MESIWKFLSTLITPSGIVLGMCLGAVLFMNEQAIAQEQEPPQKEKSPEVVPPKVETPSPIPQTPAPAPPTSPPAQPENRVEETLQLEGGILAPIPKEAPSLGPFSNLNFGGLIDYRYIPAPRTSTAGAGFLVIHVNELFVSTNIGEHISILAEQLLLTSGQETTVGQDHGFVYATFTNLPYLPSDLSFRLGRFRFRYGIDAVSDSAINPVRTLVYKDIGFILKSHFIV